MVVTLFNICHLMLYVADRGVSRGPTQGQAALGPDLVAVRIPAPVLASQVPAVAARVHLRKQLTSPAPLTGTVKYFAAFDSLSSQRIFRKCKLEIDSNIMKVHKIDKLFLSRDLEWLY